MPITEPPQVPSHLIPVVADYLRSLRRWLIDQRPVQGLGVTVTDAPGGGRRIDAGGGGGVPNDEPRPFLLVDASDARGHKLRVLAGTVNNKLPNGFSAGDDPPYILSVSGQGSVWIRAGWSFTSENVSTLDLAVLSDTPHDAPGVYWKRLGDFNVSTEEGFFFDSLIGGSQQLQICAGVTPLWGLT